MVSSGAARIIGCAAMALCICSLLVASSFLRHADEAYRPQHDSKARLPANLGSGAARGPTATATTRIAADRRGGVSDPAPLQDGGSGDDGAAGVGGVEGAEPGAAPISVTTAAAAADAAASKEADGGGAVDLDAAAISGGVSDDAVAVRRAPITAIPSTASVRQYFSNILAIVMMSPSRYHAIRKVQDHYAPFFQNMYFTGPKKDARDELTVDGITMHLYDIVYGNEQYRAVAAIIREQMLVRNATFEGYLYVCDDILLQPWSIAAKQFNKKIPWATQMGIANLNSTKMVSAVPGMSVQGKYRSQWPYWRKNRPKLFGVAIEGGTAFREAMFRSAKATHPLIYKWSKYSKNRLDDASLHWTIFYTIVDTYYIPRSLALRYCERCDLMAKHWIFGECAIATAIRSISTVFETMDVQFYWSTLKADDCHRYKWNVLLEGFHRCRHDHKFAHVMYGDDATRQRLFTDKAFLSQALRINGLDESTASPAA